MIEQEQIHIMFDDSIVDLQVIDAECGTGSISVDVICDIMNKLMNRVLLV